MQNIVSPLKHCYIYEQCYEVQHLRGYIYTGNYAWLLYQTRHVKKVRRPHTEVLIGDKELYPIIGLVAPKGTRLNYKVNAHFLQFKVNKKKLHNFVGYIYVMFRFILKICIFRTRQRIDMGSFLY